MFLRHVSKLARFAAVISMAGSAFSADRPNILFLFSDDHALKAISAYGGPLLLAWPGDSKPKLIQLSLITS